ncbi:MAG TPA: DUF362 domain-containing protein [Thermoanaerobaculaceae bacterium]|nr:DUF362 domain-containing protein [Thermoanaerobaculaceae bacterium]HPS77343.1 DUF362 domain-containing protein [Thermoanaerobaculaceae bacterium]
MSHYSSLTDTLNFDRRELLRAAGAGAALLGGRLVLGVPSASGQEKLAEVTTNIDEFMKVPRGPHALPGPFPGRVVKVTAQQALAGDTVDGKVVREMVEDGIRTLTGNSLRTSFRMLFSPDDVIGLKVNPVGTPLIATHPEVVDAVIRWLVSNKVPRSNIVIWDRFEGMLVEAGFTPKRFPGVRIEGLQRMAEEGQSFRDAAGQHISAASFDREAVYLARGVVGKGVRGYQDDEYYLNQHVFNGEESYFGSLITKRLTKIVNLAAYKNTGNGISMATKNIGYAAICNTGRLHQPLFFQVCTEVLAAPWIREKLVLNITDGLRGQYDGGPDKNEQFVYPNRALYFATDPFALDMVCHRELMAVRKAKGVTVNEHPRFTEYLYYAEKLGLGVATPERIKLVEVKA